MTNPETAREEAVNPLLGQLLRARGELVVIECK